jgi:outer membrane receptor protein involved in Fe transport
MSAAVPASARDVPGSAPTAREPVEDDVAEDAHATGTQVAATDPAGIAAGAAEDIELSEVVVTGATDAAPAEIERESVAVVEAINVKDLAKTGDSDVAASLKRVVGVSVQGGRFAVVRGLASRYVSNTLNGDLMASTNPYRRDVELDLFPAGILSGILIQKSFTADMPGDSTGGSIRIATRDPEPGFSGGASLKVGATRGTLGRDIYSYRGGNTDWLGMDDGIRGLPKAIDTITHGGLQNPSAGDSATYAAQLPDIYNLERRNGGPEYGLSLELGNGMSMGSGMFNVLGVMSYDRGAESRKEGTRADLRNVTQTSFSRDTYGTELDGYFVAGFKADAGWKAYSRTTLLRQTEDTAEFEAGMDVDDSTPFDQTLLEFNERQFFAEQLQATFLPVPGHEMQVRLGYSQTSSQTPDRRSYRFQDGRFVSTSLERLYADLNEQALDFGLDYSLGLQWTDTLSSKVKAGALYDRRNRTNDLVRLGIAPVTVNSADDLETLLTPANFANGTYRLQGRSTGTDSYGADQDTIAAFVSTDTALREALGLVAGLRFEAFKTTLDFPNSPSTPQASLDSRDVLPSVGLNWRPAEDLQLRAAYSRTVSRPTISELSPSVFFDDRGRRFVGCTVQTVSGLKPCDASTIDNYDARAEYYFSRTDSVSVAVFHKQIDKPLERGLLDGGTSGYTYRNSKSARLTGVELDGQVGWIAGAGHKFTVGANVSFIDSKIKLDADGQRIESISSRKLQGQSPLLANARLTYEQPAWQQTLTLSYSYFGDRIDVAGGNGLQPLYEKGRNAVNLTYEKRFDGGAKVGLKLLNLTDDDYVYTQRDTADTGTVIERWRNGRSGEITFSYEF